MPIADVWVLDVDALARDGQLDRFRAHLSTAERDRLAAFHFDVDRTAYLAAHGLARAALTYRAPGVPPSSWQFTTTSHGRPEVAEPADRRDLRVNLSHTRRTVACVVTSEVSCGVDVEEVDARTDVDLLARGVLTDAERDHLDGLAAGDRRTAFFHYWTLKEAYVKARGLGLSLPMDRCGFDLGTPILATPPPDDDVTTWQFTQWTPTPTTVVAVALATPCTVTRHTTAP